MPKDRRAEMGHAEYQYIPHTGGMVKNLKTGRYTHEQHFLAVEQLYHMQAMASADGEEAAEIERWV